MKYFKHKVRCVNPSYVDGLPRGAVKAEGVRTDANSNGAWFYEGYFYTESGDGSVEDWGTFNPPVTAAELQGSSPEFDPAPTKRKEGKVRVDLVLSGMPNALLELGRLMGWALGKGYKEGDWLEVPNYQTAYLGAEARHLLESLAGTKFDPESGLGHDVHEAWNAIAKLERRLRDDKAAGNDLRIEGSIK